MKQLFPNLQNSLLIQYQATVTYEDDTVAIDGLPHVVPLAHNEIEKKLQEIRIETLSPCKPILFLSFKRKLTLMTPMVAIIVSDGNTNHLCCKNKETLHDILQIYQQPFHKEVKFTGVPVAMETKWLQNVEQDCQVDISLNETGAIVRGYVETSVSSAKKTLVSKVKNLKIAYRAIDCPPGIGPYIHYVIFNRPTEKTKEFISNLRVKVSSKQGGVVYLQGSNDIVCEDEKKLVQFMVPPVLQHKEFLFSADCRFIPQIEIKLLCPLHQKNTFTHIVTRRHSNQDTTAHQSGRTSRQRYHSSSEVKSGFTITLYCSNKEEFQHICSAMEVCPCTFIVSCLCILFPCLNSSADIYTITYGML